MRKNRYSRVSGMAIGVMLLILLAGCGVGDVSSLPSATTTPLTQATATTQPTATPFTVGGVSYKLVTDSMFGFSFAIPADTRQLSISPQPQVGGDTNTWSDRDTGTSTVLNVDFGGATTGYTANQCPQSISGAKQVSVGKGITGYEQDDLVIGSAPQGAAAIPEISVSFVSNGNVIFITLTPQTQGNLTERYGGIWQEMLASFQPGTFTNPTPICDS